MNRLKELRQEKDLTLLELREELKDKQGITFSTSQLSFFENGKRSPRRKDAWELIADYFNVSVSYILGYNSLENETDIKVAVIDEMLKKLHAINDGILVESDEGPSMWSIGFGTAIVAIESFKKEIEDRKEEENQ